MQARREKTAEHIDLIVQTSNAHIFEFEVRSEQRLWVGSAMGLIFMIRSNRMGLHLTFSRRVVYQEER